MLVFVADCIALSSKCAHELASHACLTCGFCYNLWLLLSRWSVHMGIIAWYSIQQIQFIRIRTWKIKQVHRYKQSLPFNLEACNLVKALFRSKGGSKLGAVKRTNELFRGTGAKNSSGQLKSECQRNPFKSNIIVKRTVQIKHQREKEAQKPRSHLRCFLVQDPVNARPKHIMSRTKSN